jgi:hypothetical protein
MRIISTEYITMYSISYNETEYIRQVGTNMNGENEIPIWMFNNNGLLDIVVDEKLIEDLESNFLKNIN